MYVRSYPLGQNCASALVGLLYLPQCRFVNWLKVQIQLQISWTPWILQNIVVSFHFDTASHPLFSILALFWIINFFASELFQSGYDLFNSIFPVVSVYLFLYCIFNVRNNVGLLLHSECCKSVLTFNLILFFLENRDCQLFIFTLRHLFHLYILLTTFKIFLWKAMATCDKNNLELVDCAVLFF